MGGIMVSVTDDGGVVVRRRERWRELMRRGMPDDALYVIIDAPASEAITVRGDGGVPLVVRGDSSVVSLGTDVRVSGRASVQVSGGACVMAFGSSRVRADGYVRVAAHDDVRVWVGSQVSVYKCAMFGAFTGRVEGGRVVVKRNASDMSGRRWCRAQLVHVDEDGLARLFKATDGQGRSSRGVVYSVGEVVDDTVNWAADRFFGCGLHVSPSPLQAFGRAPRLRSCEGARFFEVTCPVSELVPLADDVCKAPRLRVVREVDAWGEPL